MQAVELLVCQPDQIIQRQPLGEFAEPVAGAGADQRIEIAPVVRQLRRLCNLLPQRLLLLTSLASRTSRSRRRLRSLSKGWPLSQVELAFFTTPV